MCVEMSMRAGVRDGDPAAFRELFDEYHRSVYNHAFRLTGSWVVAEDVVSLAFLEAWRLRGQVDVDFDGSLRPWLLGITTNIARNVRRAARRHDLALARLPRQRDEPDFAEAVATRIDDRERVARVRAALAALRTTEREVLALCVFAGLDYAEAAEALGVPVGTVRSRLSRARERLRKLVAAGKLRPPREQGVEKPWAPPEKGGEKPRERREPPAGHGQVIADRTIAVRFAQENTP
jgi:RNA polymerase sigma factor (sigma-70 family)